MVSMSAAFVGTAQDVGVSNRKQIAHLTANNAAFGHSGYYHCSEKASLFREKSQSRCVKTVAENA